MYGSFFLLTDSTVNCVTTAIFITLGKKSLGWVNPIYESSCILTASNGFDGTFLFKFTSDVCLYISINITVLKYPSHTLILFHINNVRVINETLDASVHYCV